MRRSIQPAFVIAGVLCAIVVLGSAFDHWRADPVSPPGAHSGDGEPARQSVEAMFDDGVRLLREARHAEALARFRDVLRSTPTVPEAYVNAGFASVGLSRAWSAQEYFLRAIELRATQANAYWGLAVALEMLGDVEGARGAMRAFIHLAPPGTDHVRRARAALWEWGAHRVARRTGEVR